MEKRTARFLNMSLLLVAFFCIVVFIVQSGLVNLTGESTIRQLGVFYMSGISDQVSSHFGTTIELRLSQVETLVNSSPPGRMSSDSAMRVNLSYSARMAGFEYLAFYTGDGEFQTIYGTEMIPDVPEALHRSVLGGKYNVCAGQDANGTPIVLVGVPADYPMPEGGVSAALIAGLPTSYLHDTLESNLQTSSIEYTVLRDDGSCVFNNRGTEEPNYFDRVEQLYQPCNGITPAQYAAELRAAMDNDSDYTCEVLFEGARWNIYCTSLPNSEWHLLLKISHGTLDEAVNQLQQRWSYISIGGGSLIILALLLVFVGYYRLTKLHIHALDEARKTAELARRSAERSNRAKNEFLSNMSHDIRTPMNGIMGMTSIAIGSLDDPARVRTCLKRIHISSRHLLGLINDMLDMSKIESGSLTLNMEPVSLREVMQNIHIIIQPQILEKRQSFRIYIHDVQHENVCSDRVRLSQILLNILGNAVKFTPEGGEIQMDLHETPSPKGEGYIRSHLYIRDNGIGMSREFQSRIFEPFAREDSARIDKAAGGGMGMTITKYIVDAMDGEITVESEQGKGTCFHIAVDMEETVRQERELRLPPHSVLVVDGDGIEADLAVEALTSIGMRAAAAPDLETACRMLEAEPERRLVLLDQNLGEAGGIEAAKRLHQRFGRDLTAVLLTEGEWDELEDTAQEAGIRALIAKPLFRSGLYYGLRPLVSAAPQSAGTAAKLDVTGRRILLAEDNELNGEVAVELLSERGLEVDWAENGRICVDMLAKSTPGWYDGVLMDLRMPVMNGFEAAAAIRRLPRPDARAIPIIAVSADAFPDDVERCLVSGMNAHTAKPMDPDRILTLLRGYWSQ